jgi:hypothetical protein
VQEERDVAAVVDDELRALAAGVAERPPGEVPVLLERLALPGEHRDARAAIAAAAWSWVEKMLHEAQRTEAPSSTSVSIRTAVWIVMCREPVIRTPFRGFFGPNFLRTGIRPGISCSATLISLRPHSAREMSLTW